MGEESGFAAVTVLHLGVQRRMAVAIGQGEDADERAVESNLPAFTVTCMHFHLHLAEHIALNLRA